MDTLIPGFLKKVSELEKFASDKKNTRDQIISKIIQIREWIIGDRSLQQHRCAFAFMKFLYNSHGDEFQEFEGFISWLKCRNGMAKIQTTEAVIKGEKVIFKKYLVDSISFGSCTQKRFNDFFNKLQEFAQITWGINFAEWFKEYETAENTIQ